MLFMLEALPLTLHNNLDRKLSFVTSLLSTVLYIDNLADVGILRSIVGKGFA